MRKYKITMAVHGELIGVLEGEVEAENEEDATKIAYSLYPYLLRDVEEVEEVEKE